MGNPRQERFPSLIARLAHDWRALEHEQRVAGAAALALLLTMLMPWYQQNAVVNSPRQAPLESRNLDAFQVFSFVEAAVLLVAVAIGYLLYARAEGRDFRLPGSDGTVVLAAGLWAGLLLVLRLFDKPQITSHGIAANVGVQWGIFFALAAAGLLAYSGSRMRTASRGAPPADRDETARRPAGGDETAHAPERDETARPLAGRPRYPPPPATRARATRSPVAAPRATEQLSFEDTPTESRRRRA
jgi:hypothetical protein